MITIKNLSVHYEEKTAVQDVTLTFQPGKISGLIGANGAGKSSLLKACVGLIPEFEGSIAFDGKELSQNRFWVKQHCAYAPEDVELLPYLKGREFLQLIATVRNSPQPEKEIDLLQQLFSLREAENELIINYSHGMRQKISLAAALIGEPDYLIFDEALNGMDALSLSRFKNFIDQLLSRGKTIVLSSHIISLIQSWCDPVILMHEGEIFDTLSAGQIKKLEQQKKKSFTDIFVERVGTGQKSA